jgi:hypothetical protein
VWASTRHIPFGAVACPGLLQIAYSVCVSKKTSAQFHDFEFWVYDVCQGLLFAEMVGAAETVPVAERSDWLTGLISDLRVYAAINDMYIVIESCGGVDRGTASLCLRGAALCHHLSHFRLHWHHQGAILVPWT